MNEPAPLDETARDLIAAGREGVVPNDFVAERLRRSVDRALHGSAPPARSRSRTAPILAALAAAALGGALYANELVSTKERPAPPKPAPALLAPQSPPVVPTAAPTPALEPRAIEPAPQEPEQTPTSARAERPPPRSQQLSAEIELLAGVNAAVNAGDGGRALELLGEYDRTFRPSILAEELAAASVLALCAAGRTREARAAAERFTRNWQRSPLSGRIARSCAGAE